MFDPRAWGADCDRCVLQGSVPVSGAGPSKAKFAVVGEAPGEHETRLGAPFVGASGRMLDHALKNAGMQRHEARITNVLSCMPPDGQQLTKVLERITRENKAKDKRRAKAERAATKFRERLEAYYTKSRDREAIYQARVAAVKEKAQARHDIALAKYNATHSEALRRNAHAAAHGREPEALLPDRPLPPKMKLPKPPKALVAPREPALPDPADLEHVPSPIECCSPRLERELKNVETFLLVGTHAVQAFTGRDEGIFAEQGAPILLQPFEGGTPRQAVGVIHPAAILRGLWTLEYTFYHWVARAVRYYREGVPEWKDPAPFYTGAKVERQLLALLAQADALVGTDAPPIDCAIDVETDSKDPITAKLRCIGFGWGRTTAVVGVHSCEPATMGQFIAHPGALEAAKRILTHPKICKIMQNGVFDRCAAMRALGIRIEGPADDSMLAHHVLESELPHSLAFLSALLLDAPSWKSLGEGDHGLSVQIDKQLWLYNSIDCWRTLCIMPILREYLAKDGLQEVYEQAVQLQPIVADMRDNGILRSEERFAALRTLLGQHKVRCEREMRIAIETVIGPMAAEELLALGLRRAAPLSVGAPSDKHLPAQSQSQQFIGISFDDADADEGEDLSDEEEEEAEEAEEATEPASEFPVEFLPPSIRDAEPALPTLPKGKKKKKRPEDACGFGWLEMRGVKRKKKKDGTVIETEVWDPWDYARPAHIKAMLELMGIAPWVPKTEKTGMPSKKGDNLTMALANLDEAAVAWVGYPIDARRDGAGYIGAVGAQKLISTFCDMAVGPDGRIHPDWKQAGTVTGRFSCSPNLQNIPKWMRAFIAAPGYVLLSADYSALELWIVAIYAEAQNLLKALEASDAHRVNAELIYKLDFVSKLTAAGQRACGAPNHEGTGAIAMLDPEDEQGKKYILSWPADATRCQDCRVSAQVAFDEQLKKLALLRDRAKRFVYAGNYGAAVHTIWEKLVVDDPSLQIGDVAAIDKEWKRVNPEIAKRMQMSVDLYYRRQREIGAGYLESPILGRRRYWTGKEFIPSDAANYPIQSCGADIMNTALIKLYDRARALGARLIAQVHDSLVWEVPQENAKALGALLEEVMPGPYKFRDREGEWSFPIEWKVGEVWSDV